MSACKTRAERSAHNARSRSATRCSATASSGVCGGGFVEGWEGAPWLWERPGRREAPGDAQRQFSLPSRAQRPGVPAACWHKRPPAGAHLAALAARVDQIQQRSGRRERQRQQRCARAQRERRGCRKQARSGSGHPALHHLAQVPVGASQVQGAPMCCPIPDPGRPYPTRPRRLQPRLQRPAGRLTTPRGTAATAT